jgi:cytochrome c oxidase subunit 1
VSDTLTRVVFLLFLLLSIPTGFHHQYTDPGIPEGMKVVHAVLTFGVFYPSLATAFSVVAALEIGGRRRGGRGLFGWVRKLPWSDPSVVAQLLAMATFVLGGVTGLINASYSMNQVIHNTTWVPAHFHMTIGSAVTLTFVGIAYWMIPYLTGRGLHGRRLALASSWVYAIGVLVMARGLISAGLEGMPRRLFRVEATYTNPEWNLGGALAGIGGSMMFLGILAFFLVIWVTVFTGPRGKHPTDIPVSHTLTAPALTGWTAKLDRLGIWVVLTLVLIVIAYLPFFVMYLPPRFISPGFRLY